MKIDGIDPLLLNRIKEQTDRMEIQKTESLVTDSSVKRESGAPRGRTDAISDQHSERKLNEALKRLNDNAEKDSLPLRFSVRRDSNPWHVEIRDISRNEIVRDIPTDQALSVVNRIQSLFGVLVDEKR